MWKLENTEIWNTFVSVSYSRENPQEPLFDDFMFLYVDLEAIEVQIVFYDNGERFSMRHTVGRKIVHKCDKELQKLWNTVYRHGKFD